MTELEKWKPILHSMGIEEEKRGIVVEYIVHYNKMMNDNINVKNSDKIYDNLLPINLKVLSKINLDREIVIMNSPTSDDKIHCSDIQLSREIERTTLEDIKSEKALDLVMN